MSALCEAMLAEAEEKNEELQRDLTKALIENDLLRVKYMECDRQFWLLQKLYDHQDTQIRALHKELVAAYRKINQLELNPPSQRSP